MSIPPEPHMPHAATPEAAGAAGPDTAVIARLVKEFFSGPPQAAQELVVTPSAPNAIAGFPGALPTAPHFPTAPSPTPEVGLAQPSAEPTLHGGFPNAGPEAAPARPAPRHEAPASAATLHDAPAGPFSPETEDHYAFGEPRLGHEVIPLGPSRRADHLGAAPSEEAAGLYFLNSSPASLKPQTQESYSEPPPPVHPPEHRLETNRTSLPASGGHDPDSRSSYEFGEPRSNGTPRNLGGEKDGTRPRLGPPSDLDAGVSPEYYFLRGADAPQTHSLPSLVEAGSGPSLSVFDVEAIRRDFPALHQRVNGHPLIWLDNAATTHKPQQVIDATSRFYGRDNSNIHRAAHVLAARSTELFEGGREKVRQFLGAGDAKEIVFLRGTTEAINLVAQSYGRSNLGPGDEILLTEMEHHANIVPWQILSQQVGAKIRVAPINDRGELIMEEFVKLLSSRTKLVSVAHVSNSLGTINPIEQIIPLAHAHGARVLVDGAQSTPHIPIDVQALDVDFFVFSAHKIFGPTGIGALYGKADLLEQMPPWQGGGHMIRDVSFTKTVYQDAPEKFEAGTPDIAGVVGLGAAIDYLVKVGLPAIASYEHALLEYATHGLSTVPGLRPIGTAAVKASVLSFVIPGLSNQDIARHLDKHGIAVRAGHHCAQPAQRHFGLETSVRPSLAFYNTFEEVDTLVRVLHSLPRR